ncbi:MAG TPA: hypothetical protein VN864_04230, partial [Thermoplasmata archaeon]|nr:hypothetical protein [Thermoplasmata archaeon]
RAAGANTTTNLTLALTSKVSLSVDGPNGPMTNVPVRFTEIVPPVVGPPAGQTNRSASQMPTQEQANSSVVLSGSDGVATITLPQGNYSVYALGYNGSGYFAGLWSGPIGAGTSILPTLELSPAVRLYGNVTVNSSLAASLTAPAEIAAYTTTGDSAWAFTNSSGDYSIWLPAGTYGILATEASPLSAALARVSLHSPTHLSLQLFSASTFQAQVRSTGTASPIAGAAVTVTLLPGGGSGTAFTDGAGNATLVVPTGPELTAQYRYCINASAPGYVDNDRCGAQVPTLTGPNTLSLAPANVSAAVTVIGLPTPTTTVLTFTSESPTARSTSASGIGTVYLDLLPGSYSV